MKKILVVASVVLALAFVPAPVDQKEIDAAIKKGADFLLQKNGGLAESANWYELVIYTLIHADVDPSKNDLLKQGIERLIASDAATKSDKATYRVAVQALALHSLLLKVHRHPSYKYLESKIDVIQERIARCGQFLVDSQLDNGQWTYRGAAVNTPEKKGDIATGGSKAKKAPKDLKSAGAKIAWDNAAELTGTLYLLKSKSGAAGGGGTTTNPRTSRGTSSGDNSNTQYGILGLIAAQMSGCVVPDEAWSLAKEWFEKCQKEDGGFGYGYSSREDQSYGSMVTAGIIALSSSYRYLDSNHKKKDVGKALARESKIAGALRWLDNNFTVTDNPKMPGHCMFYYLYGLERVGAFLEAEKIGRHNWYDEGAEWLVRNQKPDGSWGDAWVAGRQPSGWDVTSINACFAILFLKRATSEIIETGSGGGAPPVIDQK